MLRESVREFALAQAAPGRRRTPTQRAPRPAELLAQANELGLTMVGVPEELGGAVEERSAVTTVLMSEALAQGDMGIAVACLAPAAVSTALSLWGDADQQATYLPAFVGEDVPAAALAMLEPRPLFDPFALQTTRARARTAATCSTASSRSCRAPPTPSCSSSPPSSRARPGAVHRRVRDQRASASSPSRRWAPRRRHRPADPRGRQAARRRAARRAATSTGLPECVALGRLGWCALAVGTGQAVLDYVIPYVNDRKAFGEPISNRQAVAFTVANIAIELDGMRLATYRAASRVDQGLPFAREVALARRLCAERGMAIGSDGVQLLGGHGYVKEHPVERWYRDLRAAGRDGGSSARLEHA